MVLITMETVLLLVKAIFLKLEPKPGFEFSAMVHYYTWFGGIKGPVARQIVEYYQDGSQSNVSVDRPFNIDCNIRRDNDYYNPSVYEYQNKLLMSFPLFGCIGGDFVDNKHLQTALCFRDADKFVCSNQGQKPYKVRKFDDFEHSEDKNDDAPVDVDTIRSIVGYDDKKDLSIIYNQTTKKLTAKSAEAIIKGSPAESTVPNLLAWNTVSTELYETMLLDPKYLSAVLGQTIDYFADNQEAVNAWATIRFRAYPKPNDNVEENQKIVDALCNHVVESKRKGVTILFVIITFAYLFLYTPLCAAIVVWILIDRRLHDDAAKNSGVVDKGSPKINLNSPATATPVRNEDEDVVGENSAFGKKKD